MSYNDELECKYYTYKITDTEACRIRCLMAKERPSKQLLVERYTRRISDHFDTVKEIMMSHHSNYTNTSRCSREASWKNLKQNKQDPLWQLFINLRATPGQLDSEGKMKNKGQRITNGTCHTEMYERIKNIAQSALPT